MFYSIGGLYYGMENPAFIHIVYLSETIEWTGWNPVNDKNNEINSFNSKKNLNVQLCMLALNYFFFFSHFQALQWSVFQLFNKIGIFNKEIETIQNSYLNHLDMDKK